MNKIISEIRDSLSSASDPVVKESGLRYFREPVDLYGVRSAVVGQIGREHFSRTRGMTKAVILDICEELWRSGKMEESFIACNWSYALKKQYTRDDFYIFERWVSNYVSNWASCDTLCNHTVGTVIDLFPDLLSELKQWAHSPNRWMRRAAAVSLIIPARQGRYLDDIFEIAGILLTDSDDMVQKGYGWMLKAASQAHCHDVFEYVMKNKKDMPRTALRYAIEKMPAELKREAMAR